MNELDALIERHGGWSDAFRAESKTYPATATPIRKAAESATGFEAE